MRLRLAMIPMLCIYMLLISATCIVKKGTSIVNGQDLTITDYNHSHLVKKQKLNFFQRLAVKLFIKKNKLKGGVDADKLASASLLLGIGACAFILLGLFIPYVILASIPAGAAAMITGGSAVRNKTSLIGKAKTGKGLGLAALIAFGVLLILAAILVAAIY